MEKTTLSKKQKIWVGISVAVGVALVIAIIVVTAIFPYLGRYLFDTKRFDVSQTPMTDELTIMSFNVRGFTTDDMYKRSYFYRAALQRQVIEENAPDVIGFQEANDVPVYYLKRHLKGYTFVIRTVNFEEKETSMYLAYRTDRFEEVARGHFWLSETPDVPSRSWDTACVRCANYVTLRDKRTGKTFTAVNTHLDHVSELARRNGMQVILDKISALGATSYVLMGDMNCPAGSAAYNKAINFGLKDASAVADEAYYGVGATYHGYGEYLYYPAIDFFFVTPDFAVSKYCVFDKLYDGAYPSDHFPIVMKASL